MTRRRLPADGVRMADPQPAPSHLHGSPSQPRDVPRRRARGRISGRSLLVAVGLAVSVVFTYLAVRDVDFGLFWDGLRASNYWLVPPTLAALAVTVLIRTVRWQLLFVRDQRPPLGPTASALLIGNFFNIVLPARAGEAARVVALHQRTGASRATALGTAVSERVYDVVALLVILFVAVPFLPDVTWLRTAVVFAAVVFAALVVVVVALSVWGDRPVRGLLRPLALLPRVSRERAEAAGKNLAEGLAGFRNPRVALPAFLVTVVSWLALGVSYWILLAAFDLGLGFGAAMLAVVATNLALVLPSSPAAIGVFEAATQVSLAAYGVSASHALSYAVVLHAVNLFPFLAAGYVVLHRHSTAVRRSSAPGYDAA